MRFLQETSIEVLRVVGMDGILLLLLRFTEAIYVPKDHMSLPVIVNYMPRMAYCADCIAPYLKNAPNQTRCNACAKAHEREYHKRYEQRRKARGR